MRRRGIAALTAVLSIGVLLMGGGVAQAAPVLDKPIVNGIVLSPEPTLVAEGLMVPDCEGLTDEAREYAVANEIDICGILDPPGSVSTRDIRTGQCGSSAIFAYQAAGYSIQINYGFQSTVGNMALRALEVTWVGTAASDYNLDFAFMNAATYNGSYTEYAGRGYAAVELGGTATTVWGLICYLLGPFDDINVT